MFGFHVGPILLFLLAVITLPIHWFVQLRERVHINKFAKIGIYFVVFMIGVLITPTQDGAKEADNGTTETVTEVVSTTNNTVVSGKDGANSADKKVAEQDTAVKDPTEEQTTEQFASEQKSENQDVTEQITSEVTEVQTTEVQTTEAQTTEMQATEAQVTKEQTTEEQTTETPTPEVQTTAEQTTEEYTTAEQTPVTSTYVLNTSKMKFHKPNCSSVKQMKDSNRSEYNGTRDEVIAMGYSPCGRCKP